MRQKSKKRSEIHKRLRIDDDNYNDERIFFGPIWRTITITLCYHRAITPTLQELLTHDLSDHWLKKIWTRPEAIPARQYFHQTGDSDQKEIQEKDNLECPSVNHFFKHLSSNIIPPILTSCTLDWVNRILWLDVKHDLFPKSFACKGNF